MEKPSLVLEKREEPKEIQRLELDPDKGIDIVIETNPDLKLDSAAAAFKPAKVVLEKDGEVITDFQGELPPKYKFVFVPEKKEENIWRCDKKYLSAIIMPEEWGSNKNILSLLHEVGHAFNDSQDQEMEVVDSKIEDLKLEVMQLEREMSADMTGEEKKDKIEDLVKRAHRLEEEYLKLKARNERSAWAKALQMVRKFRRQGIDLIAPFRGRASKETGGNLDNFIHKLCLGSYEKLLIRNEGLKFLEGIFTKKYKEEAEKEVEEISKKVSKEI